MVLTFAALRIANLKRQESWGTVVQHWTLSEWGIAVAGELAPEGLVPTQPVQQSLGGIFRGHVLDDEDRRRKIGRQFADQLVESFQAARRRADDDDVAALARHVPLPSIRSTACAVCNAPRNPEFQ